MSPLIEKVRQDMATIQREEISKQAQRAKEDRRMLVTMFIQMTAALGAAFAGGAATLGLILHLLGKI